MERAKWVIGGRFRRISAHVEDWRLIFGRLVCAGAGVRGWCDFMLHSSISSIGEVKMGDKQLKHCAFLRWRQVEPRLDSGLFLELS